jgi:hypothetical protein
MTLSDERNEGGEGTLCKGKSRFVAIRDFWWVARINPGDL